MRERTLLRLAAVLAVAAIGLTAWVAIAGTPLPGDVRLTREIQARETFAATADAINFAGSWSLVPFIAVSLAVAFGRWLGWPAQRAIGQRWQALFSFGAVAALRFWDQLLKQILRLPRPTEAFGVRIDHVRDSFGFPSGHVYGDVVLYGVVAVFAPLWLPRRLVLPVRAVLLAVILLSGPARVYVGAHWPSDTAGGYLWGGAALCLALACGRWAARRM